MVQEEFAEYLGVSSDFLSAMERGSRAPSFETLELLADRLDMTVSDLFDFGGKGVGRKRVRLPRRRSSALLASGPETSKQEVTTK
jgi:transcriptional regulator with XRE-family HTH domain